MRTDATGAKRVFAFNKPPKSTWKHYWKLAVPSRLRSATNSSLPPESGAGNRPTTAANWSGGSGKSAANCSARRAATGTTPIRSDPTGSSPLPGIPAMCHAASSRTSSKTSASSATNSTSASSNPVTLPVAPVLRPRYAGGKPSFGRFPASVPGALDVTTPGATSATLADGAAECSRSPDGRRPSSRT